MKKALAGFIVLALIAGAATAFAKDHDMKGKMKWHGQGNGLGMTMHQLWQDHVVYTRNYIISALADLPDANAVAERLLKNQDQIGDAIKPYYGDAAGAKLAAMLRQHIMIATEVVTAAKSGNKTELTTAQDKWMANADEIAAFLAGANPKWNKNELVVMLHKHLDLTTQEVVSRLNKDWAGDIAAYDEGQAHMMSFANILTKGIMEQYPKKF